MLEVLKSSSIGRTLNPANLYRQYPVLFATNERIKLHIHKHLHKYTWTRSHSTLYEDIFISHSMRLQLSFAEELLYYIVLFHS